MFIGLPSTLLFMAENISLSSGSGGISSDTDTIIGNNGSGNKMVTNFRSTSFYRLLQAGIGGGVTGLVIGISLLIVSIKVGRLAPIKNSVILPACIALLG